MEPARPRVGSGTLFSPRDGPRLKPAPGPAHPSLPPASPGARSSSVRAPLSGGACRGREGGRGPAPLGVAGIGRKGIRTPAALTPRPGPPLTGRRPSPTCHSFGRPRLHPTSTTTLVRAMRTSQGSNSLATPGRGRLPAPPRRLRGSARGHADPGGRRWESGKEGRRGLAWEPARPCTPRLLCEGHGPPWSPASGLTRMSAFLSKFHLRPPPQGRSMERSQ